MAARKWNKLQPRSLRHGMELCLEHARLTKNLSVERVADGMGLASRYTLYKWLENGRMPISLVRPFEFTCGADYMTRYLCHSAFKLMVDMPTGKKVSDTEINALQADFAESIGVLIDFYSGSVEASEAMASLASVMEKIAYHRGNVERFHAPELEFTEFES